MTHEELVEKVARAMSRFHGEDPDRKDEHFLCDADGNPLPDWRWYEDEAREVLAAVYEAIKEPSEEMADAFYAVTDAHPWTLGEAMAAMLSASPLKGGE